LVRDFGPPTIDGTDGDGDPDSRAQTPVLVIENVDRPTSN